MESNFFKAVAIAILATSAFAAPQSSNEVCSSQTDHIITHEPCTYVKLPKHIKPIDVNHAIGVTEGQTTD